LCPPGCQESWWNLLRLENDVLHPGSCGCGQLCTYEGLTLRIGKLRRFWFGQTAILSLRFKVPVKSSALQLLNWKSG